MFAATEAFLPFEIELTRERLRPIGFTTIGGMLEQKVANAHVVLSVHCKGGAEGRNFFRTPPD